MCTDVSMSASHGITVRSNCNQMLIQIQKTVFVEEVTLICSKPPSKKVYKSMTIYLEVFACIKRGKVYELTSQGLFQHIIHFNNQANEFFRVLPGHVSHTYFQPV